MKYTKCEVIEMKNGFAFLLILFGVLALLTNFYAFSFRELWPYLWPAGLIVLGLSSFIKHRQIRLPALIFMAVGTLFFLRAMRILVVSNDEMWSYIWPTVLILIGLQILLQREPGIKLEIQKDNHEPNTETSERNKSLSNQKVYNVFLGAIDERLDNQSFEGCTINCVMGGADLDLSAIDWQGSAYLELNAVLGAIECVLPKGIKLQISGTPLAGGFDNLCESDDSSERILHVSYTALLGGIELKQK